MDLLHSTKRESTSRQAITQCLQALNEGDADALDRLIPLVYDGLRALAHEKLRFERSGHTLSTTALVHEAYLRLVDQREVQWNGRTHFFAIAAQAMRRILVNYAARRKAAKRGGRAVRLTFAQAGDLNLSEDRLDDVLDLDRALNRMERFNPRGCRIVEYRFFAGLTHEEIADVMGLSLSTVERSWAVTRRWLQGELRES